MELDKDTFDLLPATMKEAVEGLREVHNSPDEMAIPAVLGIANFACQGLYDVDPYRWNNVIPLSLYLVIISGSGTRKSTVLNELMYGAKDYVEEQTERVKVELPIYNIYHKQWKADLAKELKTNPGNPQFIKEPLKIVGDNFILQKATTNGLLLALTNTPHCGLINADAGDFFNSHSFRQGKNGEGEEMAATMSKAWSGEVNAKQTGVQENNIKVYNRRFMMLAMVQEELAGILANNNYNAQGLIPRILITKLEPQKPLFKQQNNIKNTKKTTKFDKFNERVYELLNKVIQSSAHNKTVTALKGASVNDPAGLCLITIKCDESKDLEDMSDSFARYLYDMEHDIKYEKLNAYLIRMYEQMIRIAATLAAFSGKNKITLDEMACAIGISMWFIDHRLDLELDVEPEDKIVIVSEEILSWSVRRSVITCSNRQLQQGVRSYKNLSARDRNSVIDELLSRSVISYEIDEKSKKQTITFL